MNLICINYQSKKNKKHPILVGGGSIPFILFCSQNNYVLLKILYNEKILDIKNICIPRQTQTTKDTKSTKETPNSHDLVEEEGGGQRK